VGVVGLDKVASLGGLCRWRIVEVAKSGVALVVGAWWVGGDVGGKALRYAACDGHQE